MGALILVIEDDEAIGEVVCDVLSEEGYSVACAASSEQARRLLTAPDASRWDLVISDASLSMGVDPRTWLHELRDLTAAPIMILSAWSETIFAGYTEQGFAALVSKPFDIDELLAAVAQCVSASAAKAVSHLPEGDVLVVTALPEVTYRTYMDTAHALQSTPLALVRHVLCDVAPLLAEATVTVERQAQGTWPAGMHVHATLRWHNMLLHKGVQCSLSPQALRLHAHVEDTVALAMDLLERSGETYALAHRAVQRARARQPVGR